MAVEIERKFLLASEAWRPLVKAKMHIRDGLIASSDERKARVRIVEERATVAIKTKRVEGRREEFEYEIPMADAERLIECCGTNVLEKTRHLISLEDVTWEIDEYSGLLKGVILAEVEVRAPDQQIVLPEWIGREITSDASYRKINMLRAREKRAAG